jgi:hypothetical protein
MMLPQITPASREAWDRPFEKGDKQNGYYIFMQQPSQLNNPKLLLVSDSVKTPQFYCGIFRKM